MSIDQNTDTVEQRRFIPPLHLQRYNVVAQLSRLLCGGGSTTLLDVGSSTCEFGGFVLTPDNAESVFHYIALDPHEPSLVVGAARVEESTRSKLRVVGESNGCSWLPRRASLVAGSVFDLQSPDASRCPRRRTATTSSSSSSSCSAAPHANCIVSIDVVEHIPLGDDNNNNNNNNSNNSNGPHQFLQCLFCTAPCPHCTRAVIVTTPNRADNVPVLGMREGERRHWDHKFEWDLAEMAGACRRALASSTSSSCFAAWIHFGVGGTASQGCAAISKEALACGEGELLGALRELWEFDEKQQQDDNSDSHKELFVKAAELFAAHVKFGTLLAFETLTPTRRGEGEEEEEVAKSNNHNAAAAAPVKIVSQLDFFDHRPGSESGLWGTLYAAVEQAAKKLGSARVERATQYEEQDEDEEYIDDDDDQQHQSSSPAPALSWNTTARVAANDDDDEEEIVPLPDRGQEDYAAVRRSDDTDRDEVKLPFSAIANDPAITKLLASIPLCALWFLRGDDAASIPSSIPAVSAAQRNFARFLDRSLQQMMPVVEEEEKELDGDFPSSLSRAALTVSLAAALSKQQLEDLMWAAVDGFHDGAVCDEETGERSLVV